MSGNNVDEKVVSIKFDNSLFADKVSETLGMIKNLKGGLDFTESGKSIDALDATAKRFSLSSMLGHVKDAGSKFLGLGTDASRSISGIDESAKNFSLSGMEHGVDRASTKLDGLGTEGTKSIGNIESAAGRFNLSGIVNSVDHATAKFTAFSVAAGVVLGGIVTKALDSGRRMADGLLGPILSGGKDRALNIEQAKFMFKGLGIDVTKSMDSALKAVKGTAYGLDEAASVAAQFGGAGVKAGDEMTAALRGISGLAAISGTSFSDIGSVMTGIAGVGKVTGEDLMQFGTRGINVAAALGKQMGMTETQVRKMVSDGKLDFKTFAAYMDKAFGAHATEGNKIYSGSLSNIHAAMSRLGASIQTPRLEEMRKIFNALTPVIDNVSAALKPLIDVIAFFSNLITNSFVKAIGKVDFGQFTLGMAVVSRIASNLIQIFAKMFFVLKDAFRDIFPKEQIGIFLRLVLAIDSFVQKIKDGGLEADKFRSIFRGVFAIFAIGIEVVKGIFEVVKTLIGALLPAGDGFLSFAAGAGEAAVRLKTMLVDGGGIKRFFENISVRVKFAAEAIRQFIGKVKDLFGGAKFPDASKLADKFSIFDKIKDKLGFIGKIKDVLSGFGPGLKAVLEKLGGFFSDFRAKVVKNFDAGDAYGLINEGLFATILLAISGVIKKFGKVVEDTGGVVNQIKSIFGGVTDTLKTMQLELKADALKRIAIAMGILTASILVLSLIDGDALVKALTAMGIGFAQIATAMVLLDKANVSGTSLITLAFGMIGIAGAMLILATAVKLFSTMNWGELERGLGGVSVGLGLMVLAIKGMGDAPDGLIRASFAMILIGGALNVIALAVKQFAQLSWADMARGLTGVAIALGLMVVAMNSVDGSRMLSASIGMIAISVALALLAKVVQTFGSMDWHTMGQGLLGVAGSLAVIVIAMNNVDGPKLAVASVALIGVGIALNIIALAVKQFGSMDWSALAKGIGGIAATMLVLVVAVNAMSGAVTGALAMIVVAGAVAILGKVIGELGKMSLGDIGKAMLGLAGALLILGLAAAGAEFVLPGLIAMALALPLIGLGFVLMGGGAYLAALAFKEFNDAFGKGADAFGKSFDAFKKVVTGFVKMMPGLAADAALFVLNFAGAFLKGLPPIIAALVKALGLLLDGLIKLLPKVTKILGQLIGAIIKIIRDHAPDLIAAAFEIISALLKGLDNHTAEFTQRAVNIITKFLEVLAGSADQLAQAGSDFIIAFLDAIGKHVDDIVTAVTNLIVTFIDAIATHIGEIQTAAASLITSFISGLGAQANAIVTAGANLIVSFLTGVASNIIKIVDAVANIITTFITTFGQKASDIATAGAQALASFIGGIGDNIQTVVDQGAQVIVKIIEGITKAFVFIIAAGTEAVKQFLEGIASSVDTIVTKGAQIIVKIIEGISKAFVFIVAAGTEAVKQFLDGIGKSIETITTRGADFIINLIKGITGVLELITVIAVSTILKFIKGITDNISLVIDQGSSIVLKFIEGLGKKSIEVANAAAGIIIKFINDLADAIDNNRQALNDAGWHLARAIIDGMSGGMFSMVGEAVDSAVSMAHSVINGALHALGINSPSKVFHEIGMSVGEGFSNGITRSITDHIKPAFSKTGQWVGNSFSQAAGSSTFYNAGANVTASFLTGISDTTPAVGAASTDVTQQAMDPIQKLSESTMPHDTGVGISQKLADGVTEGAPKVRSALEGLTNLVAEAFKRMSLNTSAYRAVGAAISESFAQGLSSHSSHSTTATPASMARSAIGSFRETMSDIAAASANIETLNPVIAPVLDLSGIESGVGALNNLLGVDTLRPTVSQSQARYILHTNQRSDSTSQAAPADTTPTQFIFNQVNNSPKSLSTSDIYRNTKSQIAKAKEALSI